MTKRDSIDTFHLFHDIMYNSVCISYNIHNKQNSKKHTFRDGPQSKYVPSPAIGDLYVVHSHLRMCAAL